MFLRYLILFLNHLFICLISLNGLYETLSARVRLVLGRFFSYWRGHTIWIHTLFHALEKRRRYWLPLVGFPYVSVVIAVLRTELSHQFGQEWLLCRGVEPLVLFDHARLSIIHVGRSRSWFGLHRTWRVKNHPHIWVGSFEINGCPDCWSQVSPFLVVPSYIVSKANSLIPRWILYWPVKRVPVLHQLQSISRTASDSYSVYGVRTHDNGPQLTIVIYQHHSFGIADYWNDTLHSLTAIVVDAHRRKTDFFETSIAGAAASRAHHSTGPQTVDFCVCLPSNPADQRLQIF